MSKLTQNTKYCHACHHQLSYTKLYEYIQCPICHSFTYVSDVSADIENKAYFDKVFKTLIDRKDNLWKRKLFEHYQLVDQKRRKNQYADFHTKRDQIMKSLDHPSKVLEIGFGTGEHLYRLLQRGIEAYGIDLSEIAVNNFKEKYPEYANYVQCGARFFKKVDSIYCCALFEHLDQPEQFINDVAFCLRRNGLLIIDGLPILNENSNDLTADEDINFWKPCHRAIYSLNGLTTLLANHGFTAEICATHDDYNYRVLSLHFMHGYRKIKELRSIYIKHKALPSIFRYYNICREALNINALANYGCVMFRKN
jgi:LSD1 subclass zinc finger protein